MIRVGHVFYEYCPPIGPWRHWIASNPNVDCAVFCFRRTNENLSPHGKVYVDSASEALRKIGRTKLQRVITRPAAFVAHRRAWNGFLRETDPEILHVQFADKAARLLPMLRRARRPLVVTMHGGDVNTAHQRGPDYLNQLSKLFDHATLFQCVSETVRESALRCGCPEHKLRVLHIGAPVNARRSQPTSRTDDCIFACVGSLVKRKGQHVLLRALAETRKDIPRGALHLFGDGPQRDELKQMSVDLGIADAVHFHGHTENQKVQNAMTEVDVAILVSEKDELGHGEGMPVCLKEAGALGLPSIGTHCDGIPELVLDGKTGIIVQQGDQQGLSAAMIRLAKDPSLRQRMGSRARARIEESFNLDRQLQKLRDFYHEAIELASDSATERKATAN